MSKNIKTLQGAIICLALSLAMLLGLPGESWASSNASEYVSSISNLSITSATSIKFDYDTPPDNYEGLVYIWDTPVPTATEKPKWKSTLSSAKGHFEAANLPLNLLKGQYTVGITAAPYRDTVSATQILNDGQPIRSSDSTLLVTSKFLDNIDAFFNSPPNIVASDNRTWFILREGGTLGSGNVIAQQKKGFPGSSGLIKVDFKAGTLKEGQKYNLAMNPGVESNLPISAGYVFTYRLQ